MRKGETTVKSIFIAVLFFGAVISGFGVFIAGASSEYGLDTGLPDFDKSSNITSIMTSIQDAMTSGNPFSTAIAFFALPVTMVIQMFNAVGYVNDMIAYTMSDSLGFAVPSFFIGLIEAVALVVVVFTVINAMTGRRDA